MCKLNSNVFLSGTLYRSDVDVDVDVYVDVEADVDVDVKTFFLIDVP